MSCPLAVAGNFLIFECRLFPNSCQASFFTSFGFDNHATIGRFVLVRGLCTCTSIQNSRAEKIIAGDCLFLILDDGLWVKRARVEASVALPRAELLGRSDE